MFASPAVVARFPGARPRGSGSAGDGLSAPGHAPGAVTAPWAPATLWWGENPLSCPFLHPPGAATVSSGGSKLWCPGMRGSNQKAKAVSREDASRWCSSPCCLTLQLVRVITESYHLGGAACFICPLAWSVELFTPHDLEDGVNW